MLILTVLRPIRRFWSLRRVPLTGVQFKLYRGFNPAVRRIISLFCFSVACSLTCPSDRNSSQAADFLKEELSFEEGLSLDGVHKLRKRPPQTTPQVSSRAGFINGGAVTRGNLASLKAPSWGFSRRRPLACTPRVASKACKFRVSSRPDGSHDQNYYTMPKTFALLRFRI